jgi:hypothetical protein
LGPIRGSSDPGGLSTVAVSTNGGATFGTAQAYTSSLPVSLGTGDGLYTLVVKVLDTSSPLKTDLTNFLNAVKTQSGTKSLTAAEATLLTSWEQDLYNRS